MWTYETSVDWKEGKVGKTQCEGKPAFEIATPPEFGGPENIWSPEDLVSSAVASCIMTSALFFFDRAKVSIRSYSSKAIATMEKLEGRLQITHIALEVTVDLEDKTQEEATQKAMKQAKKTCPVSNALNCPTDINLRFTP